MQFRIEDPDLTLITTGEPTPVLDFATKAPRATEDGEPLFAVRLMAVGVGKPELITVKVPGQPKTVALGTPVKAINLRHTAVE